MSLLPLIDADILVYRVAWTTLADPVDIAFWRMDQMIDGIYDKLGVDEGKYFLTESPSNCFRFQIDPEYKANRKDKEKPVHYDALRAYLLNEYNATLALDEEADDLLGINQRHDTVIVSIDKDLDQIPGWHYNFVKDKLYEVSPEEGLRSFYTSVIVGDTVDNIRGLAGVGPVGARKILEGCRTESDMYKAVEDAYKARGQTHLGQVAKLLKIRTKVGEVWHPPETTDSATPTELPSGSTTDS